MLTKRPPNQAIDLVTTSTLNAPRADVWRWITSVEGISKEMWPYFRMTAPAGVRDLDDLDIKPGVPFAHSRVYLFGFIPLGSWDFTLLEMDRGRGFVEQSPSTFMECWRHERRLVDDPNAPSSVRLVDHVTFVPHDPAFLVGRFMRRVFEHRHRVLRKHFGHTGDAAVACQLSVVAA
jgi:ligand-binding SRPBCC domain-containing protein